MPTVERIVLSNFKKFKHLELEFDPELNVLIGDNEAGMANAKVFSDQNSLRNTFEICLYEDNRVTCDGLFQTPGRTLSIIDYMLANKTDAAFELLDKKAAELVAPSYIQEAIAWIRA